MSGYFRCTGHWKRLRLVTEGTTLGSTLGLWAVVGDGTLTGCPNGSSDISLGFRRPL